VEDAVSSPVNFSNQSYTVTYYQNGEKKTVKRRPPPVLHNMLPEDMVKLTQTKNADFAEGDEFKVKQINPRSPNTLQITDDDGNATFVPYFDLQLQEVVAPRNGVPPKEMPERNQYLLWP
jgi:hypothetical protein